MKGNKRIDNRVQISVNLARLKTQGSTFEIAIDADKVVEFKEGKSIDVEELVQSQKIFSDMKKGLIASENELKKVFKNKDFTEIVKTIIEDGEIQFTQKYRANLRELKTNKIVNLIHKTALNPKTGLVHPENRIIAAMDEAKVKINNFKSAEDQVKDIVNKLRPIIPISLEEVEFRISIPAQYATRVNGVLHSVGKMFETRWLSDGSLMTKMKIPAGLGNDLIDKLNSLTQGNCQIDKI